MRSPQISAIALAAALGLAVAAQAQTPPPPGPPPPGGPGGWGWGRHDQAERFQARRAERLRGLHDVLAIRPDQEAAFQAFATAMAPEAGPGPDRWARHAGREGGMAGVPQGRPTTPERLDLMLKRFDERTAHARMALERRATATKTLYAALDPAQQRTLDALPTLIGRGEGSPGPGARGGSATGD